MHWKFTVNAGFLGARRDRFTQYQPNRSLPERFALAGQIPGVQGIELKFPFDFEDRVLIHNLLEQHELVLSAVNVDTKDAAHFRHGALSARDEGARRHAVDLLCQGMDMAAEFGTDIVTTCPLADGYEYPFQLDYAGAWDRFVQSVAEVTAHGPDIRFCLEYQPHELHARPLLNNVGKMLHVIAQVDAPNLGATFDVGHALAAGESPAESVALLAQQGRLFYIHHNDNTGDGGDWDMIAGTVHFWHYLELLYTLDQLGYQGWMGADIMAKQMDPVEAFSINNLVLQRMGQMLERLDTELLTSLVQMDGAVPEIYEMLTASFVERGS